MANIKNYGLVGVGSQVQFGKGGPQVINSNGVFQAKSIDGTAFVRFQVASPTANDDATSKLYVDLSTGTLATQISALQTLTSNIDAAAGLNPNGTYSAISVAHYINGATSLSNADQLLDSAIFAVQSELNAVETGAGLASSGSYVPNLAAHYISGATSLANADNLLDSAAFTLATILAATDVGAGLNPDGTYTANTSTTYIKTATSLANADALLDAGLTSEVSRATAAEATLQANITAETTRATAAEATLQSNITAETTRATAAEASLQSNITAEATRAQAAEATLTANLAAETARAEAAEATLTSNLSSEVARAEAAEATLQANITTETARAELAEGSLNTRLTTVENSYVNKDGSVAFTGDINAGGNNLINLADPVNPTDAVNLEYLNQKLTSLGNVFQYISTVTGGSTVSTPFDLNSLSNVKAGDVYMVTTGGYFTDGTNTFYAQTNDSVVKDTTATGWDVIAHVDTVVYGTTNLIDVTGTIDTGFTITIDPAFVAQVTGNAAEIGTLSTDLTNEIARAEAAEASLATNISANTTAITNEVNRAKAAEATLQSNITAETTRATAAESTLTANLAAEIARAEAAEATLTANLATETARAEAAEATLTANLAAETVRAEAAEATLTANLATEVSRAEAAEATLTANLATETARAEAAEATLSTAISNIETGVGLSVQGNYVVPTGTTYLGSTTSVMSGLTTLDSELNSVATQVKNFKTNEILSATTGLVTVLAAETGIDFSVNVNNASVQVGSIIGGNNTNSAFVIDTSNAGEIDFNATSSTATNVDIRLSPQGSGIVLIGNTGAGIVQADGGYNLTVAGGDSTTGAGGNLLLRAGQGSTQPGTVTVTDSIGNAIFSFDGSTSPTASFVATNGTSSVTLAVAGTGNVDMVLQPLGTGSVNVSGARVTNVATPTTGTDATNKNYVDTTVANSTNTLANGAVLTRVVNVSETTGTVNLGAPVSGTVIRARVLITNAFTTGASITVGSSGGSYQDLITSSEVDEQATGAYVVEVAVNYASTQLAVAVTAGTGSTGTAQVIVEYINNGTVV